MDDDDGLDLLAELEAQAKKELEDAYERRSRKGAPKLTREMIEAEVASKIARIIVEHVSGGRSGKR